MLYRKSQYAIQHDEKLLIGEERFQILMEKIEQVIKLEFILLRCTQS